MLAYNGIDGNASFYSPRPSFLHTLYFMFLYSKRNSGWIDRLYSRRLQATTFTCLYSSITYLDSIIQLTRVDRQFDFKPTLAQTFLCFTCVLTSCMPKNPLNDRERLHKIIIDKTERESRQEERKGITVNNA